MYTPSEMVQSHSMIDSPAAKLRRIGTRAAISRASPETRSEAAGGATEAAETSTVGADTVEHSLSALQDRIVRIRGGSERMTDKDRALIKTGRRAGEKLVGEGAAAALTQSEEVALEAIAVADGSRPALLLRADEFDPHDAAIGDWADKLQQLSGVLKLASQSIGRIDIGGQHLGTGWIVRPGYVVTNRHVAQALSDRPEQPTLTLSAQHRATISFGHQIDEAASRPMHPIKAIVLVGDEYIDPLENNMAKLDLAILKVAPIEEELLPTALPTSLLPVSDTIATREVFVLGYPGPATASKLPGSVIAELLGTEAGLKRLSPGEIALGVGKVAGDTKSRTIAHDATTLGGSSGSAILAFDQFKNPLVLGLHFGGYEVKYGPKGVVEYRGRNFAHSFAAMDDVIAAVNAAIAKDRAR
jgi:V8-like Glu-specific endopeptidase